MPRENRKRGKKNKKASEEDTRAQPTAIEDQGGPSWIKPPTEQETNTEAPFGYVDTDVKAYFRTVDIQIRDWAENEAMDEEFDTDRDPNEGL
jgi:nucleolar protein 9